MIAPTVGRVVWYWPGKPSVFASLSDTQPMAATVAYVHNARRVNLSVTDHLGTQFPVADVLLLQGDETYTPVTPCCQWMPHQVGQARRDGKTQFFSTALGEPFADTAVPAVSDAMVSRFLAWALPDDFAPDCGISFKGYYSAPGVGPVRFEPTGTNLLNAGQARAMLEHVLGCDVAAAAPLPAAAPATKGVCNDERACGACFSTQGACETKPAVIHLTPHEIQSGSTRVDWAEGLIRQLPETHDGRNSWLLNYGSDYIRRQAEWALRNPNSSLAEALTASQQAPDDSPPEFVEIRRTHGGIGIPARDEWLRCPVVDSEGWSRGVLVVRDGMALRAVMLGKNCRRAAAPHPVSHA